jgi:hypothetical protein
MATYAPQWIAFGLFPNRVNAENAIADLKRNGFRTEQIGMVYRDADGDAVCSGAARATMAVDGAAIGTGVGALGGALVGFAAWAGIVPIIGPVLAVGALGTVLLNAAGGAALSGVAGALIGWGIPDEDAFFYEDEVKAGRTLVTVRAYGNLGFARDILASHEGYDRTTGEEIRAAEHFSEAVGV